MYTCACDESCLQNTRSASYMCLFSRSAVDDCLHHVMGHRRKDEAHATLDPNGLPKIGLPAGFFVYLCIEHRYSLAVEQGVRVWVPWQRTHALGTLGTYRLPGSCKPLNSSPEISARIEPVFSRPCPRHSHWLLPTTST